jgi:hypothetical protein
LTERELPKVRWLGMENSGVELRIRWRNLSRKENEVDDGNPSWLSGKKLEELGFVFANGLPLGDDRAKPALDREVFLVLEYNGPAYHEAIRRAERALARLEEAQRDNPGDRSGQSDRFQAKKRIRAESSEFSRLFVVDAGRDAGLLRKLYPDPARYILSRGVIGMRYHREGERLWAGGSIRSVNPDRLHLPLQHRRILDRIMDSDRGEASKDTLPRYEVALAYGSRFEPWIETIRPLQRP